MKTEYIKKKEREQLPEISLRTKIKSRSKMNINENSTYNL